MWKPASARESVKEKNQTGKLIYLLLRDGVAGLQSGLAAGHFLLFYFFPWVTRLPPYMHSLSLKGLPAEHHVVVFRELSASHFKEPVPFNL